MGNTHPTPAVKTQLSIEYIETKKLSCEELIANIQNEFESKYRKSKIDEDGEGVIYIESWNTHVYFQRHARETDTKWILGDEPISKVFGKYKPFYLKLHRNDSSNLVGFAVHFRKPCNCFNTNCHSEETSQTSQKIEAPLTQTT